MDGRVCQSRICSPSTPRFLDPHGRTQNDMVGAECGMGSSFESLRMSGLKAQVRFYFRDNLGSMRGRDT